MHVPVHWIQSCNGCNVAYIDETMERNRDKKIGSATNLPTTSLAGSSFVIFDFDGNMKLLTVQLLLY